jgi:DNA modification methylase
VVLGAACDLAAQVDAVSDPWRKRVEIGEAVLYLGDCLEVLPTLGPVDAVVTDPPYGIGFKYDGTVDSEEKYPEMMRRIVALSDALLADGGMAFFWQGMRHASKFHEWFPAGYRLFAALKNFTQFLPTPVQYSWDPVVFWIKGDTKKRAIAGERDYHMGNTARWVAEKSNGHPCPRPEDTVEYVVGLTTGHTILDPFMGSGTTGVACARLGRRFIGVEIEERYFDIACKRIEREYAQLKLFPPDPPKGKPVQLELAE